MEDFLASACNECELQVFQPYTIDNCNFWDGTILGFFFTSCGVTVNCIQDLDEVNQLIANNQAQFIPALGTLNASTPNTVDVPFPCGPTQVTEDYTQTINYEVAFNNFDNYDFFNDLKQSGQVGEAYYVIKAGVIFKMGESPNITVDWGTNGQFLTVQGSITYDTTALDKPYRALGPIFSCVTV